MRVRIDTERCQGHGRCYDLAPDIFGEDENGYSTLRGDGRVPSELTDDAHVAVANCPESAISILEEA